MPKILKVLDPDLMIVRHIWHMEYIGQLCREVTAC